MPRVTMTLRQPVALAPGDGVLVKRAIAADIVAPLAAATGHDGAT